MEPKPGIEPGTSSLPRKCSTAELFGRNHRPDLRKKPFWAVFEERGWSELTDSNRQQPPWKGGTLPIELSPLCVGCFGHIGVRSLHCPRRRTCVRSPRAALRSSPAMAKSAQLALFLLFLFRLLTGCALEPFWDSLNGWGRFRTAVGIASGFTVHPH